MKSYFPLLSFIIVCLIGCAQPQALDFKGIESIEPKLRVGTTVDFKIGLRVQNPNSFAVDIFDVAGEAHLNGTYAGLLKLDSLQRLPARSETVVPVTASLDYKTLAQNGAKLVLEGGVPYTFKGTATAGRGKYKKTFPLNETGTLRREILQKIFSPF